MSIQIDTVDWVCDIRDCKQYSKCWQSAEPSSGDFIPYLKIENNNEIWCDSYKEPEEQE